MNDQLEAFRLRLGFARTERFGESQQAGSAIVGCTVFPERVLG